MRRTYADPGTNSPGKALPFLYDVPGLHRMYNAGRIELPCTKSNKKHRKRWGLSRRDGKKLVFMSHSRSLTGRGDSAWAKFKIRLGMMA